MNGYEYLEFIKKIEKGGDENWAIFDAEVPKFLKNPRFHSWALETSLGDEPNENFRDAAASVLAKSDFALDDVAQAKLARKLRLESNMFVRFWLANVLYKQGNRDPEVLFVWEEARARDDNPASEFARSLKDA